MIYAIYIRIGRYENNMSNYMKIQSHKINVPIYCKSNLTRCIICEGAGNATHL